MKFLRGLKDKLWLLVAFVTVYFLMWALDTSCIVKFIVGIPCPGCGLTRAWLSVFSLDFAAAFRCHPLFWTVPIVIYYIVFNFEPFRSKVLNYGVPLAIAAMFYINWIIRLLALL